jgi:hypothetical protein
MPDASLNALASCNLLGRLQHAIRLVRRNADRKAILHELYQLEKFVGVPRQQIEIRAIRHLNDTTDPPE